MTTCLAIFGLALFLALGATAAVRAAALRLGVVDRPDGYRKIHTRDMPRLGGVAVFVAFVVPLLALYLLGDVGIGVTLNEQPGKLAALLAGAAVALCAGVADDAWGLRPRWKLLLQAVAASVAVAGGVSIASVGNPFGGPISLGVLSFPVSVFWLLCCINGVNLLDGLDGLAAGVCLVACVTLFLVGLIFAQPLVMVLGACLSGALLGFLAFNFHPASIFLGDSGSMLLGFLVGAISLLGSTSASGSVTPLIPVIALGLPLFDTALAVLRRWSRKLPMSAADRQHLHHALMAIGLSHRRAVLVLYTACVGLGAAALLITIEQAEVTLLVLGSLGVVGFVCARLFGGLRLSDLWDRFAGNLARHRRSTQARVLLERLMARVRAAASLDELWEAAAAAIEGLGFDFGTLRLYRSTDSPSREFTWLSSGGSSGDLLGFEPDVWSARLAVQAERGPLGELEVAKSVWDEPLPAEAPELLNRIRTEMAARIEQLPAADAAPAWRPPVLDTAERPLVGVSERIA